MSLIFNRQVENMSITAGNTSSATKAGSDKIFSTHFQCRVGPILKIGNDEGTCVTYVRKEQLVWHPCQYTFFFLVCTNNANTRHRGSLITSELALGHNPSSSIQLVVLLVSILFVFELTL